MVEGKKPAGDEKSKPFGGKEALALARQGKDAWNAWADANPGREVDFDGVECREAGTRDGQD